MCFSLVFSPQGLSSGLPLREASPTCLCRQPLSLYPICALHGPSPARHRLPCLRSFVLTASQPPCCPRSVASKALPALTYRSEPSTKCTLTIYRWVECYLIGGPLGHLLCGFVSKELTHMSPGCSEGGVIVLLAFSASQLYGTSILGLCKVGFPFLHPRTVIFLMPVSDRPYLLTLMRRQASAWYLCLTLLEKCGS